MKYAVSALLMLIVTSMMTLAWAQDPLGLPPVPVPADNPQTPEKVSLGKTLFEDKRLSGDGSISCSTCHAAGQGFSDGQPVSEGINKSKGTRNAPTLINAAYYTTQFWDGRRPSLEGQANDPFVNPIEHGLKDHNALLDVIRKDASYPAQFKAVFGGEPDKISMDLVTKAIASFERTLVAADSPFDRYQYGNDKTALSEEAIRGLNVFRTKGRCSTCHVIGPKDALFTDNAFHNLGVGFDKVEPRMYEIVNAFRAAVANGKTVDELVLQGADASQLGRVLVTITPTTLDSKAIGRFKTPTLRNVALTAPYMHDGSIATLEEVVELYNKGNEKNPRLDPLFKPLNLSAQEKTDLVAFMKSLTSPSLPTLQASNP
ncbi:MAG TPA: cytochrome c peroxidase [Gammaproteobacteria bacterium]|nr:cytochrome c peroxidase [Gammaproteobacteria bacterium]